MKRTFTTVGPLIIVAEKNRVSGSETTEGGPRTLSTDQDQMCLV